jgi:integrase
MASITTRAGRRIVQFVALDGKRCTISLGRMTERNARLFAAALDRLLAARRAAVPPDAATEAWLAALPDELHARLAAAGLVQGRGVETLGVFIDTWLAGRRDYKPASLVAWGQVARDLRQHFGADRQLRCIDRGAAEGFRQWLIERGLRPTTVSKRLQHARMMFAAAADRGLITANPFAGIRHRGGNPAERRHYVPVADAERLIEHAPNTTWRLLIALSRFAGLRVPSEALMLKWADVDWERGRFLVGEPKNENRAGRGMRAVPLFPLLRPHLEQAFQEAPDGAQYVFPEEYRRRAAGPRGWNGCNLRTTLLKIVRRARLVPWPRLWHSMRASCESDLAAAFPLATVAKWLGNTPAIALRHYVDATDADFGRAAQWLPQRAAIALQQVHESSGTSKQTFSASSPQVGILQQGDERKRMVQNDLMEDRGLEPLTFWLPARRSPN